MKRKVMKPLFAVTAGLVGLAVIGAFRLTAIDIQPQSASAPVTTFATEAFQVDLPASFKPYLITYALYWPDGRIIFEEMALKWPLKSATSRMREVESRSRPGQAEEVQAAPEVSNPVWFEDLQPVLGRPAALVFEAGPAGADGGPAVNRGLPLVLEVQTGDGWLRFFEAAGSDARLWNPDLEGEPERYQARRARFVGRIKSFLEHYLWTGTEPLEPTAPGTYRTRHGLIRKTGDEDFIYSIALARFIDDERRMGLNIDARLGYYDWGGLQLCEADRLTRIIYQINLTSTFLARTNCRQFPVGGRMGYETIVSEGLGSLGPGSAYLLNWQEDWTRTRIGNFLISFHMTSPAGGAAPDAPEVVVGQWRSMLESVSFAPPAAAPPVTVEAAL